LPLVEAGVTASQPQADLAGGHLVGANHLEVCLDRLVEAALLAQGVAAEQGVAGARQPD
jgi:hypothetical protein